MKKYTFLKIFSIAFIVLVSLVFLLGGTKPVQYSWKAVILDSSLNLTGGTGGVHDSNYGGWVYNDSDEFANINVFVRTWSQRGNVNYYTPVFNLDVYTGSQIEFKDFQLDSWGQDSTLNRCGFPNTQGFSMPYCFEAFLNQPHPADGYKRILLSHEGMCCATQEEADFTRMAIGETKVMRLHGFIEGQNIYGDCADSDPYDYHCLYLRAHGWEKAPGNFDIYLQRLETDIWKIVVYTQFDNPDPNYNQGYPGAFSYQDDEIEEEYAVCIPEKVKNRTVLKHYIQHPAWGRGLVAYEILFIRSQQ